MMICVEKSGRTQGKGATDRETQCKGSTSRGNVDHRGSFSPATASCGGRWHDSNLHSETFPVGTDKTKKCSLTEFGMTCVVTFRRDIPLKTCFRTRGMTYICLIPGLRHVFKRGKRYSSNSTDTATGTWPAAQLSRCHPSTAGATRVQQGLVEPSAGSGLYSLTRWTGFSLATDNLPPHPTQRGNGLQKEMPLPHEQEPGEPSPGARSSGCRRGLKGLQERWDKGRTPTLVHNRSLIESAGGLSRRGSWAI